MHPIVYNNVPWLSKSPNVFLFQNTLPGITPKKGPWTEEEQILFISLLGKYGPGNWGVFSTHIPGRVGFQCAEFYRELIKSGLIAPDNSLLESIDSEYNNYVETPTGSQVKLEQKPKSQSHPTINSHTSTIKLEDKKI